MDSGHDARDRSSIRLYVPGIDTASCNEDTNGQRERRTPRSFTPGCPARPRCRTQHACQANNIMWTVHPGRRATHASPPHIHARATSAAISPPAAAATNPRSSHRARSTALHFPALDVDLRRRSSAGSAFRVIVQRWGLIARSKRSRRKTPNSCRAPGAIARRVGTKGARHARIAGEKSPPAGLRASTAAPSLGFEPQHDRVALATTGCAASPRLRAFAAVVERVELSQSRPASSP